jgi:hypothetical protein
MEVGAELVVEEAAQPSRPLAQKCTGLGQGERAERGIGKAQR